MKSRDNNFSKIAIHGVPRSGTSWIGEIFNSSPNTVYRYQPLFSYAHKDYLGVKSSKEDIDSFFLRLLDCEDSFTNQSDRRLNGQFPVFQKGRISHVLYKEVRYINILCNLLEKTNDVLLCAVVRNPFSVINSWLQAPREFRRDLNWSELDEWRYAPNKNLNKPEEYNGYEKWKEALKTFLFLKMKYPNRVHIQSYAEMLSDPIGNTQKMFDFFKLDFTNSTIKFLEDSTGHTSDGSYSVFRSGQRDDKWKSELEASIVEQITHDLRDSGLGQYID